MNVLGPDGNNKLIKSSYVTAVPVNLGSKGYVVASASVNAKSNKYGDYLVCWDHHFGGINADNPYLSKDKNYLYNKKLIYKM